MLTKQCSRCRKIIPYGLTYCEDCQKIMDDQVEKIKAKRTANYDRFRRDKKSKAFYNSDPWKMLSAKKLQDDKYRCQVCGAIATEVHHIVPIKKDWFKRFDINNLMSVCTSCHNKLDR